MAALLFIFAAAATSCGSGEDAATPVAPLRLALAIGDDLTLGGGPLYPFGLALAPDGRRLVFPAARDGRVQLWLRDLTTGDTQPLTSTEGAVLPFWSPDGAAVGFFSGGWMRSIRLADNAVEDLAAAPSPRGAAWSDTGEIVFAPDEAGGLFRRTRAGEVHPLTTLDEPGETSHRFPQLVGGAVVFFVESADATRRGIWIASLDDASARRRLTGSDAGALVIDDALVYDSGGALVAQTVDLDSRALQGRPVLIGPSVGHGAEHQLFATAGDDVLIFGAPASTARELRRLDARGNTRGVVGEPMEAWEVRVAPRGNRVAVARVDPQLNTLDIWTYDDNRPVPRRISPSIDADASPAWSPDATRLAWVSARRTVTVRAAGADRPESVLLTFDDTVRVSDWSPDGQWLVLAVATPGRGTDVVLLPASGPGEVTAYAASPFNETYGAISPDGRWMAYASDESGRFEVYVDRFPDAGHRARVTLGGGTEPRWSPDGRAIYFRRGGTLHVVRPRLSGGTPEALSTEQVYAADGDIRSFDVTPGGELIVNVAAAPAAERHRPLEAVVHVRSVLAAQ